MDTQLQRQDQKGIWSDDFSGELSQRVNGHISSRQGDRVSKFRGKTLASPLRWLAHEPMKREELQAIRELTAAVKALTAALPTHPVGEPPPADQDIIDAAREKLQRRKAGVA